jgi:lipopolysaccharide transport system permease protein
MMLTENRSAEASWTELRPSRGWRAQLDIRDAWRHRELALFLALRDLQLRYRQTIFGIAWAVLQPLAAVGIFTLVFSRVEGLDTGDIPYVVFAYVAMVIWTYTSTSVDAAARSLIEDRSLVERVYFPRILAPAAALLPGLLDLAVSIVIVSIFFVIFAVGLPATAVLLPVGILLAMLVALGVGVWLCALNVQYRDVRYALSFGLQLWFFATPIVYPSSLLDGTWRWLYAANPLVGVVDGVRWSVLGASPPPLADVVSIFSGAVILLTGMLYFHAVQRRFADVI